MRTRSLIATLFLPCALAVAAACGGSPTPPVAPEIPAAPASTIAPPVTTAPTAPTTPPPADTAAGIPSTPVAPVSSSDPNNYNWAGMTHEQKIGHMKNVVLPKMADVFKGYDGKKWQNVTCSTCHGEGAKQGKFDMPNPKLPKLSYTDNFKKHMNKDAKMTKFMMEQVEPQMAANLGKPVYDMTTKTGFGCSGCHVVGP